MGNQLEVGYSARTLKPGVSYHALENPVCRANRTERIGIFKKTSWVQYG